MEGKTKILFGGPLTGKTHFLKHIQSQNKHLVYVDCLELFLSKFNFEKSASVQDLLVDFCPTINFKHNHVFIFDNIDHLDQQKLGLFTTITRQKSKLKIIVACRR